jgi:hypothetical protein
MGSKNMPAIDTQNSLELNLLDNGIDFILKGIDELFDEKYTINGYYGALGVSPKGYKYGYLHLFSGFLLLLKERLAMHLPELIFKGKLSEVRKKLSEKKGSPPNTVNLDEALERLEIGPQVVFSEKEIETIRGMQSFRNQFEHFKVSAEKDKLWSTISDFLIIVDNFLVKELKINIETSISGTELREKIENIETVWRRIQEQKKQAWQTDIEERLLDFTEIREQVIKEFKDEIYASKGYFMPYTVCPNCGNESLIISGDYIGICTNIKCNGTFPITDCSRCSEPTIGFEWEFNLCDNCNEWFEKE